MNQLIFTHNSVNHNWVCLIFVWKLTRWMVRFRLNLVLIVCSLSNQSQQVTTHTRHKLISKLNCQSRFEKS